MIYRVWNIYIYIHILSSFSTQHAQRCVPARSVVTQWVCYPENHVNAFFWKKEPHWRRWGLPGTQNRTAAANAFFPVHKSSSATSASEQLLGLLLLKELSEAGAFSARLWHGVTPPVQRPPGPAPMPEAAENTPAAENCLSRSSYISSSSSCSEALVSCRKRFLNRKKCIRHWGSVLSPG